MAVDWIENELTNKSDLQHEWNISEKDRKELMKIIPYWRNKTLKDQIINGLPDFVEKSRDVGLFNISMHEDSGLGHILLDFPKLLQEGISGKISRCKQTIHRLDLSNPNDFNRYLFLTAAIIVLEATSSHILRYSQEALRQSNIEKDAQRKKELIRISNICIQISKNPPSTFYAALQLIWFIQLISQIETNGSSVSLGRLDQYLYKLYKSDLGKSYTTKEKQQELLDCFFLKVASIIKIRPLSRKTLHAGMTRYQNLTIGGQDIYGRDATNDLTFMCLTARDHCNTVDPQLSLRIHAGTPNLLMIKAVKLLRKGGGHPALFSDEVIIPSLINRGIPLYKARDYAIIGCVEIGVLGLWGRCDGGYVNMVKCLTHAINGAAGKNNDISYPPTLIKSKISTFEDFLNYYGDYLNYTIHCQTIENNWIDMTQEKFMPHIFMSCFEPGCLESATDVTSGGARFNWTSPMGVGLANVSNSLYAIKHLIFEKNSLTIKKLAEILESNFINNESFRQELLSLKKYGNDEDEVDEIANRVFNIFCNLIEKQINHRGTNFVPAMYSLTSNVALGLVTQATPDGRKDKTPFADGISPVQGTDISGPTAVLKSISKIDCIRATGGVILNQKYNPNLLEKDSDVLNFISLIKVFLNNLKGMQVQFNVITKETLLKAQKNPEKYRDLIIRVTGFSARFVDLSKLIQDDVINRTEYKNF